MSKIETVNKFFWKALNHLFWVVAAVGIVTAFANRARIVREVRNDECAKKCVVVTEDRATANYSFTATTVDTWLGIETKCECLSGK